MSLKNAKVKGFTLIELLVVISIIGILSSFAIVSLNSARTKARDALRKGDMAQLRIALDLYYDDNEQYPICDALDWDPFDAMFGSDIDDGSDCYNDAATVGNLNAAIADPIRPLMLSVPMDPRNPNNETVAEDPADGNDTHIYLYISNSTGQQYTVLYRLEEDPGTIKYIRGF